MKINSPDDWFEEIFHEFEDNELPDTFNGDGDVKYHLGYQAVRRLTSGDEIEIRLSSNPSHLEAVDRSSKEKPALDSEFAAIPSTGKRSCRYSCMAMQRSSHRESSPRRLICRSYTVTALAAPFI